MGCGCNMPSEASYNDAGSVLSGYSAWRAPQMGGNGGWFTETAQWIQGAAEDFGAAFGISVEAGPASGTDSGGGSSGSGDASAPDLIGMALTGGAGAAVGAIVGDLFAREPWWGAGLGAAVALGARALMARAS